MSFDFSIPPRVAEWRDRITGFVDDVVIPREQDAFARGVDDALRADLQCAAKAAVLLEEAGRSLLGPLALGCSAPDEGNIHLLHMIGSADQRRKYLRPLAGTSEEMLVGRIYADVRAFRIDDGASEVHRMSIANRAARRARADARDGAPASTTAGPRADG